MNKIVKKFLLAGDKFMSEMPFYLNLPISACGSFTENKEEYKNKKTQEIQEIYQNELKKMCFWHDMAHG